MMQDYNRLFNCKFFHFTVDTDTATIGGIKGGGGWLLSRTSHIKRMIKKIIEKIKSWFTPKETNGST